MSRTQTVTHVEPLPLAEPRGLAVPHTIRFPRGIPGFEACRSFVLMAPEGDGPLQYLKAVDGPPASFLVIDPRRVMPTYGCELTETDRLQLGGDDHTTFLWLSLVMVEADGTITVNLRAPIVINPARMIGQQVIPSQSAYPIRHVLLEAE
jgi:flagellar assembly factor FliW